MSRKLAFIWFLVLCLPGCSGAVQRLTEAQRLEVFQFVWEQVRDSHYDPKLGGVDWDAVRTEFEPRVRAAQSNAEFYALLNEMLGRLQQSHTQVIPPGAFVAERESRGIAGGADAGLVVQLVEGKPIVARVRRGSSAMRAGVPPGSEILAVGDIEGQSVLEKIRARRLPLVQERMQVQLAFAGLLSGAPGARIQVRYRDLEGRERTVELTCEKPRGEIAQFGNLPPIPVVIESRRLPGNIGYIAFNAFMPGVMRQLPEIIRSMRDTQGLILDLRGNIGGIGLMAAGVAGYLVEKETPLGTMYLRTGTFGFVAYPQAGVYTKPVVVLVDELTASTAEILAAGLQEAKRVKVVGRPTPGMALPSKVVELPYGGLLQCVVADFETPRRRRIEGAGVQPDAPIELTQAMFRESEDPILQKAVEILTPVPQLK